MARAKSWIRPDFGDSDPENFMPSFYFSAYTYAANSFTMPENGLREFLFVPSITACTTVQAVIPVNGSSNGKGKISPIPHLRNYLIDFDET